MALTRRSILKALFVTPLAYAALGFLPVVMPERRKAKPHRASVIDLEDDVGRDGLTWGPEGPPDGALVCDNTEGILRQFQAARDEWVTWEDRGAVGLRRTPALKMRP